ncbi:MAG: hypothetical protein H6613_01125 [Ignavibacteriales bacterium]|nr:hypothetical protein [Ignavibacteriales bacterium]
MKKLFKNYEFELDKNQKKILSSFAKQAVKQMEGDDKLVSEVRVFNSVIDKLGSADDKVKFTKEEKTRLTFQLKENTKHLQKKVDGSWFLTRWFYRNMFNQYNNILSIFAD